MSSCVEMFIVLSCIIIFVCLLACFVQPVDVIITEVIVLEMMAGLISILSIGLTVHAAPQGYSKYGELAEEVYQDELGLLACTVWAEAGNQDLHGKELVVDVVLNRLDNPNYPDTIKEVIFDKYQFSTVLDGGLNKAYYNVTEDCYMAVIRKAL